MLIYLHSYWFVNTIMIWHLNWLTEYNLHSNASHKECHASLCLNWGSTVVCDLTLCNISN